MASSPDRQVRTALQPVSTGFELVDDEEALQHRFLAYAFPSCSPDPAHPVVLGRPDFVAAAPTFPGVPRLRLPPASPRRYDGKATKVSHPHPKQQRLTAHDVLIDPEAGDTVESGRVVCQLRQHRPDRCATLSATSSRADEPARGPRHARPAAV